MSINERVNKKIIRFLGDKIRINVSSYIEYLVWSEFFRHLSHHQIKTEICAQLWNEICEQH